MPKIKIIAKEKGRALVEYIVKNDTRRVSVKLSQINAGEVSQDILDNAIPYGVDWDTLYPFMPGIGFQMRRVGIWTKQDAINNPNAVKSAVIRASSRITKDIIS